MHDKACWGIHSLKLSRSFPPAGEWSACGEAVNVVVELQCVSLGNELVHIVMDEEYPHVFQANTKHTCIFISELSVCCLIDLFPPHFYEPPRCNDWALHICAFPSTSAYKQCFMVFAVFLFF